MCANREGAGKGGEGGRDADEGVEVDARPDEHGAAEGEEDERGDGVSEYNLCEHPCKDVVVAL